MKIMILICGLWLMPSLAFASAGTGLTGAQVFKVTLITEIRFLMGGDEKGTSGIKGLKQLLANRDSCKTLICVFEHLEKIIAVEEKVLEKQRMLIFLQNGEDLTAGFMAERRDQFTPSYIVKLDELRAELDHTFMYANMVRINVRRHQLLGEILDKQKQAISCRLE